MKFWEKFKHNVSFRHLGFGVLLFALSIMLSFFESADDVEVIFENTSVDIISEQYQMNIPYETIDHAELVTMPERGTNIEGTDNIVLRTGTWRNETWGEYSVCADLDATNCIVVYLSDGQICVFSCKSNRETESIYNTLMTYLQ